MFWIKYEIQIQPIWDDEEKEINECDIQCSMVTQNGGIFGMMANVDK